MTRYSPLAAGASALVRVICAGIALAALFAPSTATAQCDAARQCCVTPAPGGDPTCSDTPAVLPPTSPRPGAGLRRSRPAFRA